MSVCVWGWGGEREREKADVQVRTALTMFFEADTLAQVREPTVASFPAPTCKKNSLKQKPKQLSRYSLKCLRHPKWKDYSILVVLVCIAIAMIPKEDDIFRMSNLTKRQSPV